MTDLEQEKDRVSQAVELYKQENKEIDRLFYVDVETSNGKYYATPQGKVISFCKSKPIELAQNSKDNDYVYVTIGDKKYYLHRIIAFTFMKNDDQQKNVVHHIDQNTKNNQLDNLLIVSPKRHQQIHNYLNKWSKIVKFEE